MAFLCSILHLDTHISINSSFNFKVSATLQDRPRVDRCSASIFLINPNKPHIF